LNHYIGTDLNKLLATSPTELVSRNKGGVLDSPFVR
jgi:hypothetical protein